MIDVLVIAVNIFLFPVFFGRIEGLFRRSFANEQPAVIALGVLMLAALFGRLGGLFLKRFPLQARMRSADASFPVYFLIFSAPIMILTAIGGAVVLEYLAVGMGWLAAGLDGQPKDSRAITMVVVSSVLLLAGLEIYLLVRLGKKLGRDESVNAAKGNWKYGAAAEFAADFGLFVYMTIWQAVYYLVAATLLNPPSGNKLAWDTWIFGLFIMLICFGLFYLSPRAVFLTEDRKYPSTWIFIGLVFISSLLPHWLQRITGIFF